MRRTCLVAQLAPALAVLEADAVVCPHGERQKEKKKEDGLFHDYWFLVDELVRRLGLIMQNYGLFV